MPVTFDELPMSGSSVASMSVRGAIDVRREYRIDHDGYHTYRLRVFHTAPDDDGTEVYDCVSHDCVHPSLRAAVDTLRAIAKDESNA